jgi:hypothetical protein
VASAGVQYQAQQISLTRFYNNKFSSNISLPLTHTHTHFVSATHIKRMDFITVGMKVCGITCSCVYYIRLVCIVTYKTNTIRLLVK